jgi:iron complex transport system permease protein
MRENSSIRYMLVVVILLVVTLLLAAISLFLGAGSLRDSALSATFLELRGLRLVAAILVGSGLAVAGVLMQALFRNPLAEPGIIGTSAGATFGGMVVMIVCVLSPALPLPTIALLPLGSIFGGLISLWIVLAVARRCRDTLAVLLTGVVMSMLFLSLGGAISAWAHDSWDLGRALMAFSAGSLDAKSVEQLGMAAPLVMSAIIAAWCWGRRMDVLLCGEEEAISLGLDLVQARRCLIVWATLAVAGAVALGGSIAFVGLVVPHALRGLVGPSHRRLVPLAALGGACFVIACDLVVRLLPTKGEMPLSVISGVVGAPLFLYLMLRPRREGKL